VDVQRPAPTALPPQSTPVPIGRDWVVPRAGVDGFGKENALPLPNYEPRTVQLHNETLHPLRCPGPISHCTSEQWRYNTEGDYSYFHSKVTDAILCKPPVLFPIVTSYSQGISLLQVVWKS
jgi:hypothetical protein